MSKIKARWFGAAAAAALVAATLYPATGWIVRHQAAAAFGTPTLLTPGAMSFGSSVREGRVAEENPGDFPLQLACALRRARGSTAGPGGPLPGWSAASVAHLRALEPTYGREPSLHGNILRYLAGNIVVLHRDEENILLRPDELSSVAKGQPNPAQNTLGALAAFDHAAARGEELDADNAYFPMIRAVGLYAGHRDAEGDQAILRAGTKPRWDDYSRDEVVGGWRLDEKTGGEPGAVSRMAEAASLLLPHYSALRGMARLVTARAVLAEQAGRTEEGFALRRALGRSGAAMRVDSTTLIGNLVGAAISRIAMNRPGGAPTLPEASSSDAEARRAALEQEYGQYLRSIGHADEIAAVQHQSAVRRQLKAITARGLGVDAVWGKFFLLTGLHAAGMLLVSNVFWILLMGGLAVFLGRTVRIRDGQGISRAVGIGFLLCCTTPGWIAVAGSQGDWCPAAALGLLLIDAALIAQLKRGASWRAFGRNLMVASFTTVLSGALFGLLVMMGNKPAITLRSTLNLFQSPGDAGSEASLYLLSVLICALNFAVPLLTLAIVAVRSRMRRVPVSAGMVRWFPRAALPLAGVFVAAYVVLTVVTCGVETRTRTTLVESIQHEGRFTARCAGLPWPRSAPGADR